jgi:hypothetical protein
VGDQDECQRVSALAIDAGNDVDICGFVSVDHSTNPFFTGSISQLDEISKIHRADEIIFCEKSIPEMVIISSMMKLSYRNLEMKIAPSHSFFIVGNNYINTTADLYSVSISSISTTYNRLQKRAFDIVMSLVLFLLSFVCVLFSRRFSPMITNCISVLRGKMTLVGYNNTIALAELGLPRLKPSIFPVATRAETENATIEKMNVMYAKNYSISRDFSSLTKGLKYLICKK